MSKLEDWIEYMEGEGELNKMSQLSLLLKHSIADQVILDNLRRLRRMVKLSDPAEKIAHQLSNAEYLNQVHLGIIDQIKNYENKRTKSKDRPSKNQPFRDGDHGSSRDSCNS